MRPTKSAQKGKRICCGGGGGGGGRFNGGGGCLEMLGSGGPERYGLGANVVVAWRGSGRAGA